MLVNKKDTNPALLFKSSMLALLSALTLLAFTRAAAQSLGRSGADDQAVDDPILHFRVGSPSNGSTWKLPLTIRLEVNVNSMEHYKSYYSGMQVCIEVLDTLTRCNPILDPHISFDELAEGQYTARAFITDRDRVLRSHATAAVSFSIVDEDGYASHVAELVKRQRERLHVPRDTTLVEWALQRQGAEALGASPPPINATDPLLVIGVKTAVLSNFARRQAIRGTWGQQAAQFRVKVLFLGCIPILSDVQEEVERNRLRDAVAAERRVYGDLLTEELECEDAYGGLADKVRAFFHLAAATFPRTPFVMLTDDDVYLRVDELTRMLKGLRVKHRVYMGQTWGAICTRSSVPVRDDAHQNFLPSGQYPMNQLPPFAFGPHYIVSMDCVRFVSKNYWRLESLNGLEDVSVGLWLLSMQVHPTHTPQFAHLTFQLCKNTLFSFAELSTLGIQAIHNNLARGRDFCHGFDRITWDSSVSRLEMTTASADAPASNTSP
jgi:hypothetical protein